MTLLLPFSGAVRVFFWAALSCLLLPQLWAFTNKLTPEDFLVLNVNIPTAHVPTVPCPNRVPSWWSWWALRASLLTTAPKDGRQTHLSHRASKKRRGSKAKQKVPNLGVEYIQKLFVCQCQYFFSVQRLLPLHQFGSQIEAPASGTLATSPRGNACSTGAGLSSQRNCQVDTWHHQKSWTWNEAANYSKPMSYISMYIYIDYCSHLFI